MHWQGVWEKPGSPGGAQQPGAVPLAAPPPPPLARLPSFPAAPLTQEAAARPAAGNHALPHLPLTMQEKPRKRSIEELAGQQLSGADPGGELGALDPGPKSLGAEGGQGGLGTQVLCLPCWEKAEQALTRGRSALDAAPGGRGHYTRMLHSAD